MTIEQEIRDLLVSIDGNISSIQQSSQITANNSTFQLLTSQSGFANVAAGIAVQIALQQQTNQLLAVNNSQNNAIICWQKTIASELCRLIYLTEDQNELIGCIKERIEHLDKIFEMVYSKEALEIAKLTQLELQINKCCPPKQVEPEPCFKDCESPRPPDFKPIEVSWKPITFKTP